MAGSGEDALQMLGGFDFDVVVLDWSLPGMTGLDVCKKYRANGGQAPSFFSPAKPISLAEARVLIRAPTTIWLKPFDVRELAARIRSLLRRPRTVSGIEDRRCGAESRDADADHQRQEHRADAKQSALLEYLMRHPNRPFSAKALLDSAGPRCRGVGRDGTHLYEDPAPTIGYA